MCKNNDDSVEIEICQKEAKEHYAGWINECEMADCKDRIRSEFEPKFDSCNQIEDPEKRQACLDEVNSVMMEIVEEQCYPPPPTCHE
jgi:hypothetical protein